MFKYYDFIYQVEFINLNKTMIRMHSNFLNHLE